MTELLKAAHLIMVAMAAGLVLAHYVMLRTSAGREEERGLALARRTIADITTFVVVFIWISGLTLLWSRRIAGVEPLSAWFYPKLGFALIFTVAHVCQRVAAARMRRAGPTEASRRILERWGSAAWLSALMAICFAVVSFG